MSIEAMKQALEALQGHGYYDTTQQREAIKSLRQAIAEAEKGEPVAWRGYNWSHSADDWAYRDFDDPILDGNGNNVGQPLYTHPQPRKPLTDEQIMNALKLKSCDGYRAIVRAIEAAHGIKE